MATPIVQEEYWSGLQKFTFTPVGGSTYTVIHNPVVYSPSPASVADLQVPASVGASILNGGIEYAPMALPLEWEEMDWSEYQYLSQIQFLFCKMIDHEDQGYWGWLKLGNFEWIPGIATKKGKCTATFLVSQPADGQKSNINVIYPPASVSTASTSGGGSIPASKLTHYWLTFSSPWGESTPYHFTIQTPSSGSAYYNQIFWTAPYTPFYRFARIYASDAGDGSQPIYVKCDVLVGQSQSLVDYSGTIGLTNASILPTVNRAAIGMWGGGVWINMQ